MENERNHGLDICRLLAMLGIIMLHILGRGGVLSANSGSFDYWLSWLIEIFSFSSVNVFGMLSGYLGIKKKNYSTNRLIDLLITMILYSLIITIISLLADFHLFNGVKDIIISIFPIIVGKYWYITCYILVFLLMPYTNFLIIRLNQNQCKTLCIIIFFALSLIPSIVNVDLFITDNGYSAIWLLSLYIFGAVYRKLDVKIFYRWSWIIIIICNIIVLLIKAAIYYALNKEMTYMISYTSPFMVVSSLFFIQIFAKSNIKIKSPNLLMICSSAAFDVYILHTHILIYDYLIKDNFKWILNLPTITLPIMVIICAFGIYVLGVIAYVIRTFVFKLLKIDDFIKALAKPFDNLFLNGFLSKEKDTK